jgi:drug/metabolite transporter (DMT)-like permease
MIDQIDYQIAPLDVVLGGIFGIMFLLNFIIFQSNIVKNGMSISISVMRVSVLVPILVSIVFFKESLPLLNYLGIFIVLFAFVLMGKSSSIRHKISLLVLFAITGFTEIGMKLFHEIASAPDNQMLFYLFTSAFLVNLTILVQRKEKLQLKYIGAGLLLGIPNQLTSYFFLIGLNSVEAAIAYPFVSSNVVLLGFITDKYLWKSRFSTYQYIIFALILVGIIFINIR